MLFFKLQRRPQSHLCRANYLVHGSKKQDQIMYARTNKIYPLLVLCWCVLFPFKCRCVCHRSGGSVSIMRWEREGAKERSGLSLHIECVFKGALTRLLNMWVNPDNCLEVPAQRKLEILLKEVEKKGVRALTEVGNGRKALRRKHFWLKLQSRIKAIWFAMQGWNVFIVNLPPDRKRAKCHLSITQRLFFKELFNLLFCSLLLTFLFVWHLWRDK